MQILIKYVLYNMFQCHCKASESRTVVCAIKEGTVLSNDKCDASRKPTVNRSCEIIASTACTLANRRWYTSEWDEVSAISPTVLNGEHIFSC